MEQIETTLADLFDIINDKSRVGFPVNEEATNYSLEYKKPMSLFLFNDETITTYFLQSTTSYDELGCL